MTQSKPLTTTQENAIVALLEQASIAKAAEVAGVSKRTLYRWLQEPEFDTAYREARRASVAQATARAQQFSGHAVNTMLTIMADRMTKANVKLAAAAKVYDIAVKSVELDDLAARLETLEAAIRENADAKH